MGTTSGYVIGHIYKFSRIDVSKELEYIASIVPLDDLPPSLRRTSTNRRRPPKMHFGWMVDDDARAVLMAKAHETQCYVYAYDEDSDEGDEDDMLWEYAVVK